MHQKCNITAERFVRYALKVGAIELVPEGCRLKNGRMSPYFFNSGSFCTGEAIDEIANAYSEVITERFCDTDGEPAFDVLYGPPYKGTILVPIIASVQNTFGLGNIRFCTSRKEVKNHGEGGSLIGSPIKPGNRVLIVDDVITDGGTKRAAVDFIHGYGGVIAGLVIAFDRQERGTGNISAVQQFEREYQVPVHAAATLADLIVYLRKICASQDFTGNASTTALGQIVSYQMKYGVN